MEQLVLLHTEERDDSDRLDLMTKVGSQKPHESEDGKVKVKNREG